ncbi:MAG: M23 family peptidase, partial [Planctomycetia bacterium]|nr:M23 family peptidase [Planctomycetia bacterium]
MNATRRGLLIGAGAASLAPEAFAQPPEDLVLNGRLVQGGFVMGRTWPRAIVFLDGEALTTASAGGLFVVGFDRDAAGSVTLEARAGTRSATRRLTIATGHFPSS